MEVITLNIKVLHRSKDEATPAVSELRYIARTHEHASKNDLVHLEVLLPDQASRDLGDQDVLINEIEGIEKNKNAQVIRTFYYALPVEDEFDHEKQIRFSQNFVKQIFVSSGMCTILALHDKGTGNPHAHGILTVRSLDENGHWMHKQRKNYVLDEDGNKIYDRLKKTYRCGRRIMVNDWDDPENVEKWRRAFAEALNREFDRLGIDRVVTHKSYARQGLDLAPTVHLGRAATEMERRGEKTRRGDVNRAIIGERERRELERQQDRERECDRGRERGR